MRALMHYCAVRKLNGRGYERAGKGLVQMYLILTGGHARRNQPNKQHTHDYSDASRVHFRVCWGVFSLAQFFQKEVL